MRWLTVMAWIGLIALGRPAAAQSPEDARPDDPAYIVELEAERARLAAGLAQRDAHYATLERLETALAAAGRSVSSTAVTADELNRWAASCGVVVEGAPAAIEYGPIQTRRWNLRIAGRLEGIACLTLQLLDDGRAFAIDALRVTPTGSGDARGHLIGTEWALVYQRPPSGTPAPTTSAPDLPITAGPYGRRLAQEVAALRRFDARMRAGVIAQIEWTGARLGAIERAIDRCAQTTWHSGALAAARRIAPLDGRLLLTPSRGELAGQLLSETDRAIAEAVTTPPTVEWDLTGLKAARTTQFELPILPAEATGAPQLRLDAVDAPAVALAVLLGDSLLATDRAGPRFTGRIDAEHPADALAALRKAHPQLAQFNFPTPAGEGRSVSLKLVDGDSREIARLIEQVSGQPFVGCPAGVAVALAVRDAPIDGLAAALATRFAATPSCAGPAAPLEEPPADGAPPDARALSPVPGSRLVATLFDGRAETALFEAPGGALHMYTASGGCWSDTFLHFERARVVTSDRRVYVLEPAPTR